MTPRGLALRFRHLLPDAWWTLANNVLGVLGGLAVLKLISLLVDAEQYGEASLVLGLVALLTQLVLGPILTAQLRLYFDHASSDAAGTYLRRVEPWLLRGALMMAGGYLLVCFAYLFAGQRAYLALAGPALLLILLTPHVYAVFNLLEARREYRRLTLAQTLFKAAPALFLALLLALPLSRASAIILAQSFGIAVVLLLMRRGQRAPREPRPGQVPAPMPEAAAAEDRGMSPFESFGWSLYLYNAASWIISTSGRYVIDSYWSPREVGLYSINYAFWSMPYLMLNGWIETFTRSRLYAKQASGDRRGVRAIMRGRLLMAAGFGIGGTIVLLAAARPLALLLLGESYWQGLGIAAILCVAHAFFVLGNVYHSLFIAAKQPRILVRTSLAAAAITIVLSIVLVPWIGIMGAAYATLASHVLWFVALTIAARSYVREPGDASAAPAP